MLGNAISKNTAVHFLLYILFIFQFFHYEHQLLWQVKDSHIFFDSSPFKKWNPHPLPLSQVGSVTEEVTLSQALSNYFPHPVTWVICLGSSQHAQRKAQLI